MSRKEKKYHFLYKTVDTRNGNFYIGVHSTDDLNDGYVGSGKRIRNIKYRHGKNILKCEILEFYPDRKSLMVREAELVNDDLLKEEKCMNLKPGGYGGFTDEIRMKGSVLGVKKQQWLLQNNPEWRKHRTETQTNSFKNTMKETGRSGPWDGKNHSDESKLKISKSNKGKGIGNNNSQYGTRWITNGEVNKKVKKEGLVLEDGWSFGRTSK